MPPPTAPYRYEAKAWRTGVTRIAGVDEAGRGPLAGPVVAAAVVIAPDRRIRGVADSKLLLARAPRELLYALIQERAVAVGVGIVDHLTIDRINILEATRLAMAQALTALTLAPELVITDFVELRELVCPQRNLVDGDARCASVAAASIIAKVTRDRHDAGNRSGVSRVRLRPPQGLRDPRAHRRDRSPRAVPAASTVVRQRVAPGIARFLMKWGAPIWPPTPPKRSERPGGAVALLFNRQSGAVAFVFDQRPKVTVRKIGHCLAACGRRESGAVTEARRTLGQAAEAEAARALQRAGLAVIERNVRFPEGEIDLVCREDGVVVFVEVKCRRAGWDEAPAAAVSWHKQRRLTRLAQHYLKWRRLDGVRCRFDVVSVTVDARGGLNVRHVRSAFDAAGDWPGAAN